ncbi:hypothetical protein U1E44_14930 [Arenibacter sp. GZD96]|uniref:hypothetical protein n=1 Tax=Aurantibrevibacter litoralis TaxID=3106030 RepID=UPI002AFE4982|nr:hypothetical protein [Arenibacter sp. GZD-96]MEA1787393.1 hypothetical protein [Arenibacter sp. GZD-96]
MRHPNFKILFLSLLLGVISCKSQKQTSQDIQNPEGLHLLLSDFYIGDYPEKILIFRNAGALKKFFSKINQTRKPGLAVPEVDFERNMVLVYFGLMSAAGETTEMIPLAETENHLVFGEQPYREKSNNTTAASGGFFRVYTHPITEKSIVFREHP